MPLAALLRPPALSPPCRRQSGEHLLHIGAALVSPTALLWQHGVSLLGIQGLGLVVSGFDFAGLSRFRGLGLQGFRGSGMVLVFGCVWGGGYLCRLLSLRFWVRVLDVVFRQDLNRIQKPGPEIPRPQIRKPLKTGA